MSHLLNVLKYLHRSMDRLLLWLRNGKRSVTLRNIQAFTSRNLLDWGLMLSARPCYKIVKKRVCKGLFFTCHFMKLWFVCLHIIAFCYRTHFMLQMFPPCATLVQHSTCYFSFRFHPACIEMTAEEAKRLDHFFCENCSSEGQKKLQNSHATSRTQDTKVFPPSESFV